MCSFSDFALFHTLPSFILRLLSFAPYAFRGIEVGRWVDGWGHTFISTSQLNGTVLWTQGFTVSETRGNLLFCERLQPKQCQECIMHVLAVSSRTGVKKIGGPRGCLIADVNLFEIKSSTPADMKTADMRTTLSHAFWLSGKTAKTPCERI